MPARTSFTLWAMSADQSPEFKKERAGMSIPEISLELLQEPNDLS